MIYFHQFFWKIVELDDLVHDRLSVFIVGSASSGKTEVWPTLIGRYHAYGKPCNCIDLNPKAATNNELYRIVNPYIERLARCITFGY
jgi:dynein heavy chain